MMMHKLNNKTDMNVDEVSSERNKVYHETLDEEPQFMSPNLEHDASNNTTTKYHNRQ